MNVHLSVRPATKYLLLGAIFATEDLTSFQSYVTIYFFTQTFANSSVGCATKDLHMHHIYVYSSYRLHEHIHTGVRKFMCQTCDNTFTNMASLRRHQISHSDQRKYVCQTCEKRFSRASLLCRHELTHTGECQYICQTCNKRFSHASPLNTHQIIHTGECYFVCQPNEMELAHSASLRKHEAIPFVQQSDACTECYQKFDNRSDVLHSNY